MSAGSLSFVKRRYEDVASRLFGVLKAQKENLKVISLSAQSLVLQLYTNSSDLCTAIALYPNSR